MRYISKGIREGKSSEGYVLTISLIMVVFFAILFTALFMQVGAEIGGTETEMLTNRTLFIAESGIEHSLSMLRMSPNWREGFTQEPLLNIEKTETIGFYSVEFDEDVDESPWTRVPATATGVLTTDGESVITKIRADILTANPAEFFIFTTDKCTINNLAQIQNGSIYAKELVFAVNTAFPEDLIIDTPTFYLQGFDYTIEDPNGSGTSPDVVIDEVPSETGPVAFPSLNLDRYRELADPALGGNGRYFEADAVFDSGIAREPGENGVIFAEGDVYIKGEIQDPITVVAAGDIYITGSITWREEDSNPVGKLGLFAKDDIFISEEAPDSISIRAQLIADGGQFESLGERGSKLGGLEFIGSMAIRGGKDAEYGAIDLYVYAPRIYRYDPELLNSPSLPYVTYIANLDSWDELINWSQE
ncbi:hypothetical protein ACFL0T_08690 [Candidatus Omnitrophota bacterium]